MGVNTYKTYLPKDSEPLIASARSEEPILSDLHYHNQFQFIGDPLPDGDLIGNFFENIIRDKIENYYKVFLQSKIKIADNLPDTVSQFRKSKKYDFKSAVSVENFMKINKFQKNFFGEKETPKSKQKQIDLKDYATYVLREGTTVEKREFLTCLRSKLTLANKVVKISTP